MDRDLIITIVGAIVSIFGSGAMVTWITARANRQITEAMAEKTSAETEGTIAKTAIETMNNLVEPLTKRLRQVEADTEERERRLRGEIAELKDELHSQDAAIERLNAEYLKMQLGYMLNEYQLVGMGYDPVVPLSDLPTKDIDHLRLMVEGSKNVADRTIRANERKRKRDEEAAHGS